MLLYTFIQNQTVILFTQNNLDLCKYINVLLYTFIENQTVSVILFTPNNLDSHADHTSNYYHKMTFMCECVLVSLACVCGAGGGGRGLGGGGVNMLTTEH